MTPPAPGSGARAKEIERIRARYKARQEYSPDALDTDIGTLLDALDAATGAPEDAP